MPTERTPVELVAFAAWVNLPPEKVPSSMAIHTCPETAVAWKRVAEAVAAYERDRLLGER